MELGFPARMPWQGEHRNRHEAAKFSGARRAFVIKHGEGGITVVDIARKAGQSSKLGQLEETIRRFVADQDEAAEAA